MKLLLNGIDFSDYFHVDGVDPNFDKVEGPNSGIAQDGTAIIDLIDTKDSLVLKGNSLTQEQYSSLVAMCKLPYITATYDDPFTGKSGVVKVMIPTLNSSHRVEIRGSTYYTQVNVTLKER